MRGLLRFPREVGHFLWGFINPKRQAGRVPFGRLTIVLQLAAALIFVGYTMAKKGLPFPWSPEPYKIEAVFPDARGLDRLDDPGAAVAGTPLGRVTEVRYEGGRAVATLTLEPEVRGKVFRDASATIRPGSAIQNLVVNVDPGSPETGELPDEGRIEARNTTTFTPIDDLTSVLDADTRAYVQIVVSEAQRALKGSESELRQSLAELGELAETTEPVARSLATRRALLTRLVRNLDEVTNLLGDRQVLLAETINAGNHTVQVTAAREAELAELTRELGPTLVEAERALAAVNRLTVPLEPALAELARSAPALAEGLDGVRALLPDADAFITILDDLIGEGARPLELLVEGTQGIRGRIAEQIPIAEDLTALARRMDEHKEGIAQTADTLSGALSVNDNGGTYGQVNVLEIEPLRAENFGLAPSMMRASGSGPSPGERKVVRAFKLACLEGIVPACTIGRSLPGAPESTQDEGG
jgi:virulence factor Mce-like protein